MPAYIIGQVTVHDLAEYNKYLAGFPAAFAPFEGRVLVASDQVDVVEGQKIMTMPMTERLESKSTGRSCLFGGAKWIRTAGPVDQARSGGIGPVSLLHERIRSDSLLLIVTGEDWLRGA